MIAEAPSVAVMPMQDMHHQERTCGRHRPFATYEAALLHYVAKVSAGETDPGQEVFRCRGCGSWHHGGTSVRSHGRQLAEAGWDDAAYSQAASRTDDGVDDCG